MKNVKDYEIILRGVAIAHNLEVLVAELMVILCKKGILSRDDINKMNESVFNDIKNEKDLLLKNKRK